MQQYNIYKTVEDLAISTRTISEVLSGTDYLGEQELSDIDSLFIQRAEYLNIIGIWLESENGKIYLKENNSQWYSIMSEIAGLDKQNIDILKEKVKNLGDKLKDLTKQRTLLIYNSEYR